VDRLDQGVDPRSFLHHPPRTKAKRGNAILDPVAPGEHDDPRDLRQRLDVVQHRPLELQRQEQNVARDRRQRRQQLARALDVGHHLESRSSSEERPETLAEERMVIGDDETDGRLHEGLVGNIDLDSAGIFDFGRAGATGMPATVVGTRRG